MHPTQSKTAYLRLLTALITVLILFTAGGFSGCRLFTGGGSVNPGIYTTAEPGSSARPDAADQYLSDEYRFPAIDVSDWGENSVPMPVYYCDAEFSAGDITVCVPVYIGMNSARLNASLRTAFRTFAQSVVLPESEPVESAEPAETETPEGDPPPEDQSGYRIGYEIVFSDQGLISIWMILKNGAETEDAVVELDRRTFNYDVCWGKQVSLHDAFGATYTRSSAATLAEMIEEKASRKGFKLLGRLDPIPDDQIFVFALIPGPNGSAGEYGISFYFRRYEIALPSQGCPQVFIGIGALRRFSAPNSSVRRLSSAKAAESN